MILMALDHTRDFVHRGAMLFSPTDLTKTTPILFFTRWVTHFCMPVFMLTAGMGIFLWWRRGHSKGELSGFLWTRGLWLAFLEVTVMRLAYNFNFSPRFLWLLLVLWIFGICMLGMAVLARLPLKLLALLSVAMIVGPRLRAPGWIGNIVFQPGVFVMSGINVLMSYPLIPWIGVMAGGFCLGQVFLLAPELRRRILLRTGLGMMAAFIVIRALNVYGDPSPRASGLLSFLNCSKYPPSLDFLLMTLGPALFVLAYLEHWRFKPGNPLIVFGRVPLFYFVLHFYLIHLVTVILAWARYGRATLAFMFNPIPTMGGPRDIFPPDFGYSLWVAYLVWIVVVATLYPACRWFSHIKATRREWWLSYL